MSNLILYVSEYCWFCQKVEAFMQENKISIEKRDTMQNPSFRQELLEVGVKRRSHAYLLTENHFMNLTILLII